MNYKKLDRILRDNGYTLVRTNAHHIYSNGLKHIAVPHKKEINFKLARGIIKLITINREDRNVS